MKTLRADLHVHTALSPCGDDEMSPPAIVDAALAAGLDMIAVCDHNAAGNVRAVAEAAAARLAVIPGIEVTTVEEAHVVGLFPTVAAAANAADEVRGPLPTDRRRLHPLLRRAVPDERRRHGLRPRRATRSPWRPRCDSTRRSPSIKRFGGLAVAAHIDRPTFGVDRRSSASFRSRPASTRSSCRATRRPAHRRRPPAPSTGCRWCARRTATTSRTWAAWPPSSTLEAPTFPELVLAVKQRQGRIVADA